MKHAVPVSGKWFYRFSHKMVCKSVSCYKSAIMPTLCQFSRDILRYYGIIQFHLSFAILIFSVKNRCPRDLGGLVESK